MKCFVWDPEDDGFMLFTTEAEVRTAFLEAVEAADDTNELTEEDEEICWGKLTGRIRIEHDEVGTYISTEPLS